MTDPPAIQQRSDGTVLIQGTALLAQMYRSVLLGVRQHRTDGLPAHDLLAAAKVLRRAHIDAMSRSGHELVDSAPTESRCNGQDGDAWCSIGEAAILLGLSRRQVRRLAAEPLVGGGLGGVRIGRAWMLLRAPVLALAQRRKAAAK